MNFNSPEFEEVNSTSKPKCSIKLVSLHLKFETHETKFKNSLTVYFSQHSFFGVSAK